MALKPVIPVGFFLAPSRRQEPARTIAGHPAPRRPPPVPATLLRRAAERQRAAATSTLLGVALVAYAHWGGPGQAFVPWFALVRLAAQVGSHAITRRIQQLAGFGAVVSRADAALYRAKEAGRNRVELARP